MPTPVSSARQCLTDEAARSLDDAVAVARRRCHSQTTSLHAVSALLALPSSSLREACSRARSSAYSPRLQFRALELSVGVSLDRLPTAKGLEEPPISNSLMAAIKRSQANQRRHPETFQLYQHLQYQANNSDSSPPSISAVKVELKHFMLSILDDPIVSRVFGEAGFRSCDIKQAILNPPPNLSSRFSKTRCPPLFLCNLSDLELNKPGFKFPFPGVLDVDGVDENSRRIGEVLLKESARNPLLVGVCAIDALIHFTDSVQKGKDEFLPKQIGKLRVITFEKEIIGFLDRSGSEEMIRVKFKEVEDIVTGCEVAGVVVNYGDLKVFVDHVESEERVKKLVSGLSRLLEVHEGKVWLIGAAASYDTYMKFLSQFPSAEKEWNLHLLPITSSKPLTGGSYSRSGLMGSFVPFAGFFPTSSDHESTWKNGNLSGSRCQACNEKYEQEASSILKGGSTETVADLPSANQPSWLQIAQREKSKRLDIEEAKDDKAVVNAGLMALQTKWNDICHSLHGKQFYLPNNSPKAQFHEDASHLISTRSGSSSDLQLDKRGSENLRRSGSQEGDMLKPGPGDAGVDTYQGSPEMKVGRTRDPLFCGQNLTLPHDCLTSRSVSSVTTDLGLGTLYGARIGQSNKPKVQQHKDHLNTCSVSADMYCNNALKPYKVGQLSSSSVSQLCEEKNADAFKSLWRALAGKVGWQDDAVCAISRTIASCRNGHARRPGSNKGNIWLGFLGPDKVGKRRVSAALAEAIFGSSQSLLRLDLGSVDKLSFSNTVLDRQDQKSRRVHFRGKTSVDYIAEELSKKSNHVFLLENIDEADMLVQQSLSQAISTGKFPDSHGREISVNNVIFVLCSAIVKEDYLSTEAAMEYSEDRILAAKDSEIRISVGCPSGDDSKIDNTDIVVTSMRGRASPLFGSKRKLLDTCEAVRNRLLQKPRRDSEVAKSNFDLNLPVEEMEEEENHEDEYDSDPGSESSKAWLEGFWDQMDGRVNFKPFDFSGVAQKVLSEINLSFQGIFGGNCLLEIESETLMQILAAAWLSERMEALEEWITQVLCKSFREIKLKYQVMSEKVVKLMSCEGLVEEHAPGIFLPNRVPIK